MGSATVVIDPWTPRRLGRGVLAAVAPVAALTGCGELGAPKPASEQGESVIDLWRVQFVAAALLGGLVVVLAAIALVRYRRRDGDDQAELPPQNHGSALLEGLYVAVPLGIVAGLFAYTLHVDDVVRDRANDPQVEIEVTGYRWGWRFEYLDEGVVLESIAGEQPTVVLPVDAEVRFHLESTDVIHSLFVPEFLTKQDLIPGLRSTLDVHLTRTGDFLGHCAEFCGLDHARMNFTVSIVERGTYERWVREQRGRS